MADYNITIQSKKDDVSDEYDKLYPTPRIASEAFQGGVKASLKDDTYTEEVKIGTDGKLYLKKTETASDSVNTDLNRYYGNTLLISDFQDTSEWTVSQGRLQATTGTKKIGNQAINLIGNISSTYPTFEKPIQPPTNLYNGDAITEDDYVYVIYVVPDLTKIGAEIEISFYNGDYSKRYQYNLKNTSFKQGWNYAKVKLSSFRKIGGIASLSEVDHVKLLFNNADTSYASVVAFQLVQFIKKSPYGDYPSPFKEDFEIEQLANSNQLFVGKENNKIVCKNLSQISGSNDMITSHKKFKNFELSMKFRMWENPYYLPTPYWVIDNQAPNNMIRLLPTTSNTFRLQTIIDGVTTDYPIAETFSVNIGDNVEWQTSNNNGVFTARGYINGQLIFTKSLEHSLNKEGNIKIGNTSNRLMYLDSLSITNLDATTLTLSPSTQRKIGVNNVDAGLAKLEFMGNFEDYVNIGVPTTVVGLTEVGQINLDKFGNFSFMQMQVKDSVQHLIISPMNVVKSGNGIVLRGRGYNENVVEVKDFDEFLIDDDTRHPFFFLAGSMTHLEYKRNGSIVQILFSPHLNSPDNPVQLYTIIRGY